MADLLGLRELNRATLARQLLLHRSTMPVVDAVDHLAGLQAQEPNVPYLSLWARLEDFRRDVLTELLYDRRVVRSTVLRGTQHMFTADDFTWLRPTLQPMLDRIRQGGFGRRTAGIDLAELVSTARKLLDGSTLTRPELGRLLVERWPDHASDALAWSVQYLVPLVHIPPSGTWGKHGATPFTLAEQWLGRPMSTEPAPERLIRRYLAAFGPASTMDVQAWCGLTRLGEVVDRLRPTLRTFRDERGRELFDLPDAPLPDPDTAAPARFLPDVDNLMTAHANRTRVMTDEHRVRVITGAVVRATILVDGFVRGLWTIEREDGVATLVIEPFTRLSQEDVAALTEEGARLLDFAAADATDHDIRVGP